MNAMLLAAGRGERLRPITDTLPKPLVEIGGRSLIERHLERLAAAGIETVVVNLGWLGWQIAERIGSGHAYGVSVAYSPEGDDILETGGGIFRALPLLGSEPFLVVNADVYTDMPLPASLGGAFDAHLVLVPTPAYRSHGDFDLVDGLVVSAETPTCTFSGVAIYRPAFFAGCTPGRFPLAPMLHEAARDGRVSGEVYEGLWEDVGTPERLQALNGER